MALVAWRRRAGVAARRGLIARPHNAWPEKLAWLDNRARNGMIWAYVSNLAEAVNSKSS